MTRQYSSISVETTLAGSINTTATTMTVATGTATALMGGITGGTLGYGISREAQQLADRASGAAPAESVGEMAGRVGENLYEGATAEALGRIGGRALTGILGAGARAAGRVADVGTSLGGYAGNTATRILREAAGDRLPAIQAALREAPAGATPAQAIVPANAPLMQAILQKGSERAPNLFSNILAEQDREATRFLSGLAGGYSQTASRQSVISEQGQLRERLIPQLNIEMNAANTAGRLLPRLAGEANLMAGAAADSVQDVGKFLEEIETKYKIPPIMPELAQLAGVRGVKPQQFKHQFVVARRELPITAIQKSNHIAGYLELGNHTKV